MQIKKNDGPRINPWGTSASTVKECQYSEISADLII